MRTTETHPFRRLLLVVFLLLSACAGNADAVVQVTAVPETSDDVLGRGDVFEVRVYGEEELSGKYQVSSDGRIDFPLVGSLSVVGLTPGQVGHLVRERLADGEFLTQPHVSVFVLESNSRRISVIGAVAKPGTFSLTPGLSLVQVISLAGGFSNLADRNRTVVTRREEGTIQRYQVEVDAITRGNQEDFLLRPGDIVFVPERVF